MSSIKRSVVTITGGTGSFGSTMAKFLLERGAERVNILSRDEAKQDDMRRQSTDARLRFFLGDVRDANSVAPAMCGVDFVFHAAALKQAPSCEFFPQQAVKTNVVGSHNVTRAAATAGVKSLVCLSTDKPACPVNAMGMSKALMEKTAQALVRNPGRSPRSRAADRQARHCNRAMPTGRTAPLLLRRRSAPPPTHYPESQMTLAITRYGNVMYSRGSVIPLFIRQLQHGEPFTVTERTMTRFLMSLADSVDLVDHGFTYAQPGDRFIKKASASTVAVLARAVASLLGNDDPEIRVIGIRHGEKMHETLLGREEIVKASDEGDYFRVPLDARSLQAELYFDEGESGISRSEDCTSANTRQLDIQETRQLLLQLPEVKGIAGIGQ